MRFFFTVTNKLNARQEKGKTLIPLYVHEWNKKVDLCVFKTFLLFWLFQSCISNTSIL